jgi:hypothetical protein
MRFLFFCALTILGIHACKPADNSAKEKRSLDCYVRVLEAEGRIYATATMSTVGMSGAIKDSSVHPVEVPGGMMYQGAAMNLIPNKGMTYTKDFPGKYQPAHEFSWEGPNKERISFPVRMNAVKNFGFGTEKLSRSKTASFTWEPNGLEKGEALVLLWENAKENLTVPMELYIQGANPRIEFPAAKLQELVPGTWTYYIVRKKLEKAVIGPVNAQAVLEFYSKTDTITVIP